MGEEDDFEQEEDLQTNFTNCFKKLLMNKCLQKSSIQPESISMATSSQQQNNICPRKLSIEPFDGDPQQFLEFWDSFCYSVHENDSILNFQKMFYLKGLLKRDAMSCILSISGKLPPRKFPPGTFSTNQTPSW